MPEIKRSQVRAMLEEATAEQREPLLMRLKERGFTLVEDSTVVPEPGALERTGEIITAPLPLGIGRAVEAVRTDIPGIIAEKTGELATSAGPFGPAISSTGLGVAAGLGLAGELIPKTPLDVALLAAAGPVGRGLGRVGTKLLPPIEARAPNVVRAVRAAMSANILPTIPQATQSQALATAEEIVARIPFFGRRIKSMRQAQESAYQSFRTAVVRGAGPSVPPSELGEVTRGAIFETLEASTIKRERELAGLHKKILKSGGDPVTAEAAARQLDEIRVARTEATRKEAGKLYDEVAEEITPDVDKVVDINMRDSAEKWIRQYENVPSAALDSKARKLLADIRSGPGENIIENLPDPMAKADVYGLPVEGADVVKILKERKTYTFQEMQTMRSTLNSMIQQERMKVPPGQMTVEGRIYGDLKRAVDADIELFGKGLPGSLKAKFDVATAFYRDHFKGVFATPTIKNLAQLTKDTPGSVFDSLVGRGNIVDIQRVKKAVGESGFAPMRRLAVERLVTSPEGRILSGPEITKNLSSYGEEALKEILTPKQLAEVSKYRITRELPKFVESEMEKKLKGVIFEREGVFRAPEDVVNRIVSGDTATLKAVKRIVGEKGTDQYRRRIIEDIIGEAHRPELLPGQVQEKTALRIGKALREYDEAFLKEVFSPEALADIERIDDIKALLQSQPRLVAAPGTTPAASAILAPAAGAALMVISPIKGTAALIAAEIVSRFYVSEAGRRLMIEGLDPRFVKSLPVYTRIITAAANAARDNAREDRINRGVTVK